MNQPMLVSLDGSVLAERALAYAIRLAAARHTRLVLFRAVLAGAPSGMDWERQQLDAIEEAQGYLERIAQDVRAAGVPAETRASYGRPAREILAVSRELDVSAIVIATHARTGLRHLVSGSVAEEVLASSRVPVLLVHAVSGEAPAMGFDPRSARIVVPLDGSGFSETAVGVAAEFAGPESELFLVRVAPKSEGPVRDEKGEIISYLDEVEADVRRELTNYLQGIVGQLATRAPGLKVQTLVRIGDPAQGIISSVLATGADLVVMATHGRTGLPRAVIGSVAGAVLRTSSTPLLLVRPPTPSRAVNTEPEPYVPLVTF